MSCTFASNVASRVSSRASLVVLGGSSPSFTTMTLFSSFSHHKVPSFNLKSGEEQTGHDRSVKVAPWHSRSAMRLTCLSSLVFFCISGNPKLNTSQSLYNLTTAKLD